MKKKFCQAEYTEMLGFFYETEDEQQLPVDYCFLPAKHSIVVKDSDSLGFQRKTIYYFCDHHFYAMRDSYNGTPKLADVRALIKKELKCPSCGNSDCNTFNSRLRFSERRL